MDGYGSVGAQQVAAVRAAVGEALAERAEVLAERWHGELQQKLRIRPQEVFPGDRLLNDMPQLIRWIGAALANGQAMDAAGLAALRELAVLRWTQHLPVEEVLVQLQLLDDILHDAVADELDERFPEATVPDALDIARNLARVLGAIRSVLVGCYRDFQEDRLDRFGSVLAHEIRGPLAAANADVESLRLTDGDVQRRARILDRLRQSLGRVNQTLAAVRTLMIDPAVAGGGTLGREPLREVVETAVATANREADRSAPGPVEVRIDGDLPDVKIPAEPVTLVLHNLLENAVRYCDPAKDRRWVRVRVVRVEEPTSEPHWRIEVGDNGLGVPEAEQRRIFERFYRRHGEGDGFGLGLSIARQAAAQFGGEILLESAPGEGSTFSLTLPPEAVE